MSNTYDFYKPQLDSEYPIVDGPLSITTYIRALDASYSRYREKSDRLHKARGTDEEPMHLGEFDFCVFHSPYGKLVQKGHARLVRRIGCSYPNADSNMTFSYGTTSSPIPPTQRSPTSPPPRPSPPSHTMPP